MPSTMRTSFTLPVPLVQRLRHVARSNNITMTELVQTILDKGVFSRENKAREKTFAALKKARGVSDAQQTNVSSTIDETLYGESGAWKADHGR